MPRREHQPRTSSYERAEAALKKIAAQGHSPLRVKPEQKNARVNPSPQQEKSPMIPPLHQDFTPPVVQKTPQQPETVNLPTPSPVDVLQRKVAKRGRKRQRNEWTTADLRAGLKRNARTIGLAAAGLLVFGGAVTVAASAFHQEEKTDKSSPSSTVFVRQPPSVTVSPPETRPIEYIGGIDETKSILDEFDSRLSKDRNASEEVMGRTIDLAAAFFANQLHAEMPGFVLPYKPANIAASFKWLDTSNYVQQQKLTCNTDAEIMFTDIGGRAVDVNAAAVTNLGSAKILFFKALAAMYELIPPTRPSNRYDPGTKTQINTQGLRTFAFDTSKGCTRVVVLDGGELQSAVIGSEVKQHAQDLDMPYAVIDPNPRVTMINDNQILPLLGDRRVALSNLLSSNPNALKTEIGIRLNADPANRIEAADQYLRQYFGN